MTPFCLIMAQRLGSPPGHLQKALLAGLGHFWLGATRKTLIPRINPKPVLSHYKSCPVSERKLKNLEKKMSPGVCSPSDTQQTSGYISI